MVKSPVGELTAQYTVEARTFRVGPDPDARWSGARVDIRRASDDQLIAFAQYYQDTEYQWICPDHARYALFLQDFIIDTLNVRNPV